MKICSVCGHELPEESSYCTRCGAALLPSALARASGGPEAEEMNMPVLYVMVGLLILALVIPPWETPPGQPPEFLGFHFYWSPPEPDAIVSRFILTIELTTVAIAGLYFSWLFRKKT